MPIVVAAALALAAGVAGAALAAFVLRARWSHSEHERRRLAAELNRRLSELFSLQELSYIVSESLELERIVEQVVRYAMRFLDARGALIALASNDPDSEELTVGGAEGTLAELRGKSVAYDDPGLIVRALARERLELAQGSPTGPVELLRGVSAGAAAAVPLRAHGVVVGSLVVTDPRGGAFPSEDVRLLSTVATHAAVALANARFFEIVRRGKDQWETAFDALSEGIAVVDEQGRVRRANRALAALLGTTVAQVAGEDLGSQLLDDSRALVELLATARREERPLPLIVRSEQLKKVVRLTGARIPNSTMEQSIVVLIEDVTDQQAMETQLIQSEKLAAVGQLVSGVAHELNNPLTSIAGLSELLLEQKELGEKDRDHLRVVHEQAERAGRIVRNLLTFARKAPAERGLVDLNDVVQRTLVLISYDLKLKNITIDKSLARSLPPVQGDRHALQQVALNLLTNAAHAVAQNPPEERRVIRVTTDFTDRVRLVIQDSGPGIPDDVVPHLFTPFFTTKEPGQGTGLGLSITYSIVQSHGGQVTLEQDANGASRGATFVVELPPASGDAATLEPAREPLHERGLTRRTILLVDDDPAVRRLVKALFGREGHAVDVARNPLQAIDMARARGYDLILADAQASVRGKLFVEALVESKPALRQRTLVATGDIRQGTEETLARLGLRYVRKPFNLRDLLAEAARVWEGRAES
ncbi:MAG TPA: ATP-binding protein [Gemmatimonadales bacterium]|nr:ATP-binding protein [Gemmatimonadales bacterium]